VWGVVDQQAVQDLQQQQQLQYSGQQKQYKEQQQQQQPATATQCISTALHRLPCICACMPLIVVLVRSQQHTTVSSKRVFS
jgi:hypothetical protein